MAQTDLTRMKAGKSGIVKEIRGGDGVTRRLEALGVSQGTKIKKMSSMVMKGPVAIQIGSSKVAIGFVLDNFPITSNASPCEAPNVEKNAVFLNLFCDM